MVGNIGVWSGVCRFKAERPMVYNEGKINEN